jgi:hypothetical protein
MCGQLPIARQSGAEESGRLTMKVFISWSGELSGRLAEAIRDWLPAVIQAVEPFFSPDDIVKGNRWVTEIASKLAECTVGIFCITAENVNSPWLVFEAGAISNHLGSSMVCTIFFDVAPTDVSGPLTQFQGTTFKKGEMFKMVQTVNGCLEAKGLRSDSLEQAFEQWWPGFEQKVSTILSEAPVGGPQPTKRPERDMLSEVLSILRYLRRQGTKQLDIVSSAYAQPVFFHCRELAEAVLSAREPEEEAKKLGLSILELFGHLERDHNLRLGLRARDARKRMRVVLEDLRGLTRLGNGGEGSANKQTQ